MILKSIKKTAIEHAEIEPIVNKYREYKTLVKTIKDNKDMLRDNIEDEL